MASRRKRRQGKALLGCSSGPEVWLRKRAVLRALRKGEHWGGSFGASRSGAGEGREQLRMAFPQMSEDEARDTCRRVFEIRRASADFHRARPHEGGDRGETVIEGSNTWTRRSRRARA